MDEPRTRLLEAVTLLHRERSDTFDLWKASSSALPRFAFFTHYPGDVRSDVRQNEIEKHIKKPYKKKIHLTKKHGVAKRSQRPIRLAVADPSRPKSGQVTSRPRRIAGVVETASSRPRRRLCLSLWKRLLERETRASVEIDLG